jgi:hypothetical protein
MTWMRPLLTTAFGAEIAKKIGHALAEAYDKKIFRQIAKAAREAHPITAAPGPEPGGSCDSTGCHQRV